MLIWKIKCLVLVKSTAPSPLEKELEDEVKKMNKVTTLQVSPAAAGTMMIKAKMTRNNINNKTQSIPL